MELLSGGEMLVRALADEGVEHVFGYPGGAVLHIYDALFQQDRINHYLVRHEQAAGHMADAYSRVTGKTGVVLVTSGPGATNTVTPIATAYMDSIPMVILSGQVASHLIGEDAFQETDMVGISRPIVKHSFQVRHASEIPAIIKKAFYIASSGRPGPVVIDIPKDATNPAEKFAYEYPEKVKMRSYQPPFRGHSGQIRKAIEELIHAKRPVIYSGGGVVQGNASAQLTELAHLLGYPVTNTLMGLGAFPGDDEQFIGMLGMHGTYEANMTMHNADVILCVGARFDDRVTNNPAKFCPNAKVIHIDIDPATISKTIMAHIPIVGAVEPVLNEMLNQLKQLNVSKPNPEAIAAWWKQINEWRKVHGGRFEAGVDGVMKPQQVVQALDKVTNGEAIITSDVGKHQMWSAQYFKYKEPRTFLTSGGLGTMGYGLGAAIGAKVGRPDKTVVNIAGDGCFRMNMNEIATAVRCHKQLLQIVMNNHVLGMVRQWQTLFYDHRYSHTVLDDAVDFVKISEGMGAKAFRVTKMEEVEPAIRKALAMDEPVVLDCWIDQDLSVFPMVPAGASLNEVFDEEDMKNNEQSV